MIPPMMAFIAATGRSSKYWCFWVNVKQITDSGASFCHVDRSNAFVHERDVITEGYQK